VCTHTTPLPSRPQWFSESGKLVSKLFSKIGELLEEEDALVFVLIDEVESLTAARKVGSARGCAHCAVFVLIDEVQSLTAACKVGRARVGADRIDSIGGQLRSAQRSQAATALAAAATTLPLRSPAFHCSLLRLAACRALPVPVPMTPHPHATAGGCRRLGAQRRHPRRQCAAHPAGRAAPPPERHGADHQQHHGGDRPGVRGPS